jgi:hypothetical protein
MTCNKREDLVARDQNRSLLRSSFANLPSWRPICLELLFLPAVLFYYGFSLARSNIIYASNRMKRVYIWLAEASRMIGLHHERRSGEKESERESGRVCLFVSVFVFACVWFCL